jgi:type IV secretion system protein VirD4
MIALLRRQICTRSKHIGRAFLSVLLQEYGSFGLDSYSDFLFQLWANPNTGEGGKDGEFWTNNAKLLITSMTLHLLASEQAPALARLADVLTTSSFEEMQKLLSATRSPDARRLVRQFLANMAQNERLVGSVMTDIGVRFQLLASPQARPVTATNDINFQEMIETPTAFFLSIPRSETRRYRPLLACLTQQMFTAWERRGANGIGCYLDEFTNLGYIPDYADFISTARSLKVSLLMAIQNFSQLAERYGKNDAETIKANAVTHLLLPGAGLEETKYYSEHIGDTTVPTSTTNRRGSGLSEEITSSSGEARRRLMTPDELRTMPADNMLMIEATAAPLILRTKLYFEDKGLAERANIPYQVTHVRPEPEQSMPSYAQGLPPAGAGKTQKGPPIVVDGDIEEEDDDQDSQYILQE